ncbi:hypothetical protein MRB53_029273 [Persea americana]|uniref:Uncharacterized protein n=1 Tax=Persea americana TaxID=3435 RepID=A0ACC2KIH4_PERAE|nr:hypothetical protein MRB53_029273 [Persea americana]
MTSWGEVKSAMTVYSKTSLSCLRSIPFCRSSSGAGKSDLDVMDVHVTRQNLSLLLPKKHCTNIQRKNGKQEKSKAIFNLQETPESSDDIPSKIENGLFLGSRGAAFNEKRLKYLKVTHILTVRNSDSTPYPNDFKYKTIKVNDQPQENIRCHFYECFQFIDEARKGGGGILVHCRAGVSRSATIVIAYLMKTRKMNLVQALDYVQRRRPKIKPNEGFMVQLGEFENSLAGADAKAIVWLEAKFIWRKVICFFQNSFD